MFKPLQNAVFNLIEDGHEDMKSKETKWEERMSVR